MGDEARQEIGDIQRSLQTMTTDDFKSTALDGLLPHRERVRDEPGQEIDDIERSLDALTSDDFKHIDTSWSLSHHERHMRLMSEWLSGSIADNLPISGGRRKTIRCFTKIPRSTYQAIEDGTVGDILGIKHLDECHERHEYIQSMHLLYEVEEAYHAVAMRHSDCCLDLVIKARPNGECYSCSFKFPNLSDRTPPIAISDYVIFKNCTTDFAVAINIENICGDWIYFNKEKFAAHKRKLGTSDVSIKFVSCGTPFHFCHLAIEALSFSPTMQEIVFDDYETLSDKPDKIHVEASNTAALLERLDRMDASQRQAILGILEAKCRPKPYIVFGPPGTGKSQTLVEAIVQVYMRTGAKECEESPQHTDYSRYSSSKFTLRKDSKTRILVCVNSNIGTDILHERLQHELPNASVWRLNAGSRTDQPHAYDIIVTTNIKSGTLFDRIQFDYIFVDEAGHSNASESLVPVCLLKWDGCLVLAGDLNQLGPVVLCRQARELGLARSLLERVQKLPVYQPAAESGQLDKRCITMLTECYRCDQRLLAPSNKLFYNNALRCLNRTPPGLMRVLKLSAPIQLIPVDGQQEQPIRSRSWRNLEEARVCANLVVRLYQAGIEPDQVGVATAYRAQSKDIYTAIRETLDSEQLDLKHERFPTLETVKKIWTGKELEMLMQIYERQNEEERFFSANVDLASLRKKIDGKLVQANRQDILAAPFELFERRPVKCITDQQTINGPPEFETFKKVWTGQQAEMLMHIYEAHMETEKFFSANIDLRNIYKKVDGQLAQASRQDILDTPFKLYRRRVKMCTTKEQICKVDTIDGFQGNERPIMIISTVRTDPEGGHLGFIHSDYRRFNVAASRAKWLTIVIGKLKVLMHGEYWSELVANAKMELRQD